MLTRKQVRVMAAGPEFDALVATEVMGWLKWSPEVGCREGWYEENGEAHFVNKWRPSINIAPAWEVWEKLTGHRDWWQTAIHRCDGHWRASGYKHGSSVRDLAADAPTAPLAICRAALLTTLEVKATSDV